MNDWETLISGIEAITGQEKITVSARHVSALDSFCASLGELHESNSASRESMGKGLEAIAAIATERKTSGTPDGSGRWIARFHDLPGGLGTSLSLSDTRSQALELQLSRDGIPFFGGWQSLTEEKAFSFTVEKTGKGYELHLQDGRIQRTLSLGDGSGLLPWSAGIRGDHLLCSSCNMEIPWDSKFCEHCGALIPNDSQSSGESSRPEGVVLSPPPEAPMLSPPPLSKVCRSCGKSLMPDNEFCIFCGSAVELSGQPVPGKAPAESGRVRCASCGAAGNSGDRFCTKCGSLLITDSLPETSSQCASCGSPFKSGDRFCSKCGKGR